MEGVAGGAATHDFGVDLRTAGLGVLEALEHEEAAALAADEAVARGVEGAGGVRGIVVVVRAQGLEGAEAGDADGRDGRLHAAGDAGPDAAEHDLGVGLAYGVGGGGAGRGDHRVGAADAVFDGDESGRHVGDEGRDHEGGNFAGAALEQLLVVDFDGAQAADADAQDAGRVLRVLRRDLEPGVLHELGCACQGYLGEAVLVAGFLFGDVLLGIEALHFAGDLRLVLARVEERDGADAGLAGKDALPGGFHLEAEGRHAGNARDDYAGTGHWSSFLMKKGPGQVPPPVDALV